MKLDPAYWSERSQGIASLGVIALFLAAGVGSIFDLGPEPLVAGWLVLAFGAFGALFWRGLRIPWADIASWTVPLTLWMAAAVAIRPPLPWGLVGWIVGSGWFSLFVAGTPFVPWWYRSVLRKPLPSAFFEDGLDDDPPRTG